MILSCVVQWPVLPVLASITCLLAAGQGVALSAGSTEWPLVLYIHTAGAPGPHTVERASPTVGNTEWEGCIAEDSLPPQHLGDEQRNKTETGRKGGLIISATTGKSYREKLRERDEKKEERYG